jgi:hypothetical protein
MKNMKQLPSVSEHFQHRILATYGREDFEEDTL